MISRQPNRNVDNDNEPQKKKIKVEEIEKKDSFDEVRKEIVMEENANVDPDYKRDIEPKTSLMAISVHQEAQVLSLQVMSK